MKTDTRIGEIEIEDKFDPKDWLGELIDGRYQIGTDLEKSILGEGGFGAVYVATDRKFGICRIKLMNPLKTSIDIFKQEAINSWDAGTDVTFPVYDYGEHTHAQTGETGFWFVTGYRENAKTLDDYIDEHENLFFGSDFIKVLTEVCKLVSDIHKKGIVHADLKPSNILVIPENPDGTEYKINLIDFGISTNKNRDIIESIGIGTDYFRSPYQNQGIPPSSECDAHAIGKILEQYYWHEVNKDCLDLNNEKLALEIFQMVKDKLFWNILSSLDIKVLIGRDSELARISAKGMLAGRTHEYTRQGIETIPNYDKEYDYVFDANIDESTQFERFCKYLESINTKLYNESRYPFLEWIIRYSTNDCIEDGTYLDKPTAEKLLYLLELNGKQEFLSAKPIIENIYGRIQKLRERGFYFCLKEAEALGNIALKFSEYELDEDHELTIESINLLAEIYEMQIGYVEAGDAHGNALSRFNEAIKRSTENLGECHPKTLQYTANLADFILDNKAKKYKEKDCQLQASSLATKAIETLHKKYKHSSLDKDQTVATKKLISTLERAGEVKSAIKYSKLLTIHKNQNKIKEK
jgi:hypothetical protein